MAVYLSINARASRKYDICISLDILKRFQNKTDYPYVGMELVQIGDDPYNIDRQARNLDLLVHGSKGF